MVQTVVQETHFPYTITIWTAPVYHMYSAIDNDRWFEY